MSIPAGFIIERVQDFFDTDAPEVKVDIIRNVNSEYIRIAESRAWSTLLQYVLNPGNVMPADLARIFYMEDDVDYLYFPTSSQKERYTSTKLYNYWKNMTVGTPLLTGSDLATTMNSTTVTSATGGFTAAMVGEYIRVGTHPGIYKIAAVPAGNSLTLSTKFHGADFTDPNAYANLTNQYFEIRPQGTLIVAYSDQDGDIIPNSASLKLWYSQRPIPILNDQDMILLPGQCEALFVGVCSLMLKGNKYTNDAVKEIPDYEKALSQMKSLDNLDEKFRTPRDRFGSRVVFGRKRHTREVSIHSDRYY